MLTNADLAALVTLRHDLHRQPEVSGQERDTAGTVAAALAPLNPHLVLRGLGGHGLAAIWQAPQPGPTVMFRAELDALPISEIGDHPHVSQRPGTAHLCGHDGHMATLVGLARLIARRPPAKGRVVLLFQPAEEDGSGAAAVIADPRFADIAPDWAFAVHNMPGVPRGQALIAPGAANCASAGLRLAFTGRTAHASQPEAGVSPAPALAALIPALTGLAQGIPPEPGFRMVTLTHLRMGEPAFGIAPGEGEIRATLRALDDVTLDAMIAAATDLAETTANLHGLGLDITLHDRFAACTNDAGAAGLFAQALAATGTTPRGDGLPFRASEDFGRFGTAGARAAMAFVGAGTDIPMLHNPDYDYPDDLIAPCVAAFDHILRHLTG